MKLWAPKATTVDLLLPDTSDGYDPNGPMDRQRLEPVGDGYFEIPELQSGTDYGFSLDGGDLRPDPRSAAQPFGVHGPSRVVDTGTFEFSSWNGADALGSVIYELHVGTFTPEGTLDSAIERLDYLADLGVGVIELMPLAPFPGIRGWGYDGVSFTAIHDVYGGPEALQRFVDAAHRHGMGVCLDVIYNHLGPDGNYLNEFGPYFTDKHQTPWGTAINFDDDGSAGVRAHVIDAAVRWFTDFQVDALRLDAIHAMIDHSDRHILADISDAVHSYGATVGRPLRLIAESDLNDPLVITPTAEGGYGMDAQWADDVHHALRTRFTGEQHGYFKDFADPQALSKVMTGAFYHDGIHSTFRNAPWGAPVPDQISGHAFVVYDQNHDQVGNRAVGDRPSEHLSLVEQLGSLAFVILSPYTPMLFQGQEWGTHSRFQFFTDHSEFLGPLVSQGRKDEFASHGWEEIYGADMVVPDPQDITTFEDSVLDWSELDAHQSYLEFTKKLIEIRQHPDFASGDRSRTWLEEPATGQYVLHRGDSAVYLNLSESDMPLRGHIRLGYGYVSTTLGPQSLAVTTD